MFSFLSKSKPCGLEDVQEVLRDLRRQAKAARFALVEALYGGDDSLLSDNHPAVTAIAAVRAHDAFRNTSTASDQEPVVARQETLAYEGGNLGSREIYQVLRRRQEEREDPIPELSASWRARPLAKRGKVHSSTTAVGSRTSNRGLPWGLSFGSQCLEGDVELWVDASPSRAKHLKALVVRIGKAKIIVVLADAREKVRRLACFISASINALNMLQQDENYRNDRVMLFATHTHDVICLVNRALDR